MKMVLALVVAGVVGLSGLNACAADVKTQTVAALYKDKASLAGREVRVQGKVVKVNNGIMDRNFLHIQDGTGEHATSDLTVTSKQTAKVGDQVTITGRVAVDKDFGAGYAYGLIVEEASITVGK